MPAEKGSTFLLKVGDGATTPVFTTVAGLRTTQLSINGDAVVITHKGSGASHELTLRGIWINFGWSMMLLWASGRKNRVGL